MLTRPDAPADPFQIAADALLRPARFAALLDGGPRAIARAGLATLLWVGAALLFVGLSLPQLVPPDARSPVITLAVPPTMGLLATGIAMTRASGARTMLGHIAFWTLRSQLTVTPALALILGLLLAVRMSPLTLLFIGLLLGGVWLGGQQAVALATQTQHGRSARARWLLAVGALVVGTACLLIPSFRGNLAAVLGIIALGAAAGLLRPLSYMWEAPWSLLLAVLARAGVPALRLLPLHPAAYDTLCLLPLPGLTTLLLRATAADLDQGGDWVVKIAGHPGQSQAARSALRHAVRDHRLAHPLLFWLSTEPDGVALLGALADQPRPQPLVAAYAALATVPSPDSWPGVIAAQRPALDEARALPGGVALVSLLDTGSAILCAARWGEARDRLRQTMAPVGVEPDVLWNVLATLREWTGAALPVAAADRTNALRQLHDDLSDLQGWPAELLAAMGEHLLFLIEIEHRRGAWLV